MWNRSKRFPSRTRSRHMCGSASRTYPVVFEEHEHAHASAHRDNNMRAAVIHVMADAAVSVFVITGLLLARGFGWLWMDPLAGIAGATVIASWSYGLIRDTGAILLDMNPDRAMAERMRGDDRDRRRPLDRSASVAARARPSRAPSSRSRRSKQRGPDYYQTLLGRFRALVARHRRSAAAVGLRHGE